MSNETYAESAEREAARKMREREAYRDASRLWYQLMDDGGFTFRPFLSVPMFGYMVALPAYTLHVKTCTVETIYRYLLDYWEIFRRPMTYIGGWIDERDGTVYLDVSEWEAERHTALAYADLRGERAIYDLANKVSIYV